jgi:hypothetical protein
MKIKQCPDLKFLNILIAIAVLFLSYTPVKAQASSHRLAVADSLFRGKQYVQSFEYYKSILDQQQYSPALLLKMVYIQEGLNNIGQAMYYLNLYHLASNDKSALDKMEQMATKFNLRGYTATDADRFLSFYHDYYFQITLFVFALAVLGISLVFHTKIKRHKRPIASGIFLVVILIGFFVHINFGKNISEGIITHQNTYVMQGPSAGASVIDIITEGHRVEVLGKNDVWLKIRWNDNTAFVKNNTLLKVEL